jgi:hypothetical protein
VENEERTVTFEYKVSPNYSAYSISGAHGGLNAFGEIVMSVYSERGAIPRTQTFKIRSDGTIADHPDFEEKKNTVIRDVLFSICMPPPVAKALADWLNDKVAMYEKMSQAGKKEIAGGSPIMHH